MQQQELSLFDDAAFGYMPTMGNDAANDKAVSEQCGVGDAVAVNVQKDGRVNNQSPVHDQQGQAVNVQENASTNNVMCSYSPEETTVNVQENASANNRVGPIETKNVVAGNDFDAVAAEIICAVNAAAAGEIENGDVDNRIDVGVSEDSRGNRVIDERFRMRAKRQLLKIAFSDGTEMCHISATETMIQAICKIGVERVAALGMMSCHVPLVATSVVERYAQWTKPITEGWYLMAQGDTQQKYMQMKSIITQLGVDVHIEIGDSTTLVARDTVKNVAHKKKSQLSVAFPDGYTECSRDHQKVFVSAVEHIGFSKVKNTGLQFSGKQVVTSVKKYTCQVQMPDGEWLTVPVQAKDKYKMLRIISSMTRTPLTVRIE